ncbi:MAG: hypothetical protein IJ386_01150 [Clostridia bacterium]|nr:hypothetical protein [Clostridia bacterium]
MKYDERGRIISGTVGEFLYNYLKTGYSGVMTFERYLALQRRDGIEVIEDDAEGSKGSDGDADAGDLP